MRKLATAAFSFAAAILAAHYLLPHNWLLIGAAIAAAATLVGLFFKSSKRLRIFIMLPAVAVGLSWSWAFTAIFVAPVGDLHDEVKTVTAVVQNFPVVRSRGYHVDISIRYDDGPAIGARLRYFRTTELEPGDIIEFTGRFLRTDGVGESSRVDSMTARGEFLSAFPVGEIEVIGSVGRWRFFPQRLSQAHANMIEELFPEDVSAFMRALLTGRRDQLNMDPALNSALSASGIAHVVAISGMHVTFLMGFLAVFINRRKRLFAAVGIPVLLLFMAMTGFTPSVTRAGVMQMFFICAPIFRRESDGLTSLSMALILLLGLNPYSIGSVGLQLSFSATLGIMFLAPKIKNVADGILRGLKFYNEPGIRTSLTRAGVQILIMTLSAIIPTIPLTAIHFGRVSLIVPLADLLSLWAVAFAFSVGIAASVLGFIFLPLGAIAAYPVTIAARYIIDVARALASVPFASVYVSNTLIVIWLVYVYAMFIAMPALRVKVRQYLYPACLAAIGLCVVLLVTPLTSAAIVQSGKTVTVLDVGQGQSIVVTYGPYTALIDNGSLSGEHAGSIAHEFLTNQGRTTVDILIITHLHSDHVSGIEYLLSRTNVSALALADPDGSYMSHIAYDIIDLARRGGTNIIYVTETLAVSLGGATLVLYPPVGDGGENESGVAILSYSYSLRALITGDMNASSERALLRFAYIPVIDLLIVGHHGSRHSTSEELLYATRPSVGIISVGRNSFGHPTQEVLERLEQFNVTVLRTDLMGSITVSGGVAHD